MCNEKLWSEVLPYLQDDFDFVYLDIPLDKSFYEAIEYFKQIIGDEPINLIGFSLGGYLATYFASRYPQSVERLFVISNSPCCLSSNEMNQRQNILSYVNEHGYTGISRQKAASLFDPSNQTDHFIDLIIQMDSELGEDMFISQYLYTSNRTDLAPQIRNFGFLTHFYFSAGDPLINKAWISNLAGSNSKLKVINTSGNGHMLPLEKPDELAGYIKEWMLQP